MSSVLAPRSQLGKDMVEFGVIAVLLGVELFLSPDYGLEGRGHAHGVPGAIGVLVIPVEPREALGHRRYLVGSTWCAPFCE